MYIYYYIGEKAGYLGSSYFIGNLVGSLLWGWVSDKVGRRPVLLTGVIAILLTELLFGFSQNFTWAIIARLLWGILNGNIGVAKTYISEVNHLMSATGIIPGTVARIMHFKQKVTQLPHQQGLHAACFMLDIIFQ